MSNTTPKKFTDAQWCDAVAAYELGTKHAVQIARELGVSPSTVSREFGRRGCVKARRVAESVAALEAALDARDRVAAQRRAAQDLINAKRGAALDKLIHKMMKSLIAADRAGCLALAGPAIETVRRSLAN